jgi:hypothetical protein
MRAIPGPSNKRREPIEPPKPVAIDARIVDMGQFFSRSRSRRNSGVTSREMWYCERAEIVHREIHEIGGEDEGGE